ncbi:flavoprotein, HI0933 family [Kluyvera cryocrescens]|uniref:Flavoprotein, HI0933 family n=1 Tax=Kluyvera cryocrescens TaxID=580 RepID=A0A485AF28_KLUCR|nr:flavoprotein, HI0933 family [Kluyvera cryocrescens]
MPGLGATPFGYKIAEPIRGWKVLPTRAGLVPFTLHKPMLEQFQVLSGVSVPSTITAEDGTLFRESLLFTHRGLSGPAVLQISSYWQAGEFVSINLLPDVDLADFLDVQRAEHPNQSLKKHPGDATAKTSGRVPAAAWAKSQTSCSNSSTYVSSKRWSIR